MDKVHVVRHKVLVEGLSVRKVARQLGVSRNTVKRYLERAAPVRVEPSARGRPVYEKVGPRIVALLAQAPKWTGGKQRLTATRLHSMLVTEGFTVGVTLVLVGREPEADLVHVVEVDVDVDVRGRRRAFAGRARRPNLRERDDHGGACAVYLASLAERARKASTIERARAGIAWAQRARGFERLKGHPAITTVMTGIRRRHGTSPQQKAPVIDEVLAAFVATLDDELVGLRDRALLTLGWFGAFRRSELAARQPRGQTTVGPSEPVRRRCRVGSSDLSGQVRRRGRVGSSDPSG